MNIKSSDIKSKNMYLFINSCIINAIYDSQTKERLKYTFGKGSKWESFYS